MKRLFLLAILGIIALSFCSAQVPNPSIVIVAAAPSGSCSAGLPFQYAISNGSIWYCGSVAAGTGTWTQVGAGVIAGPQTVGCAVAAGAGTGASCNLTVAGWTSSQSSGLVNLSTGTAAMAAGQQLTISWPSAAAFPSFPKCVWSGYGGAGGTWTPQPGGTGANNSTAVYSSVALTISTQYYAIYSCQ